MANTCKNFLATKPTRNDFPKTGILSTSSYITPPKNNNPHLLTLEIKLLAIGPPMLPSPIKPMFLGPVEKERASSSPRRVACFRLLVDITRKAILHFSLWHHTAGGNTIESRLPCPRRSNDICRLNSAIQSREKIWRICLSGGRSRGRVRTPLCCAGQKLFGIDRRTRIDNEGIYVYIFILKTVERTVEGSTDTSFGCVGCWN